MGGLSGGGGGDLAGEGGLSMKSTVIISDSFTQKHLIYKKRLVGE